MINSKAVSCKSIIKEMVKLIEVLLKGGRHIQSNQCWLTNFLSHVVEAACCHERPGFDTNKMIISPGTLEWKHARVNLRFLIVENIPRSVIY